MYPKLAKVGVQLVDALAALGGQEPVDMSLACMCETIDALGHTGFDKAYHNVEAFKKRQPARMLNVRMGLLLGLPGMLQPEGYCLCRLFLAVLCKCL